MSSFPVNIYLLHVSPEYLILVNCGCFWSKFFFYNESWIVFASHCTL